MYPNSITVLLAILLVVLNGKAIVSYIEWLRFKIRIYFKQQENNEYNNNTTGRSQKV